MRIVTGRGTSLASKNSIACRTKKSQRIARGRHKESDLADWEHVEQFLSQELVVSVVTRDVGYQLRYVVNSWPGYGV